MSENIGKEIGRRIRQRREARRESIKALALATGIGRGTIWSLEAGKVDGPSVTTVQVCAAHFGIRMEELLYDDVDENSAVFGLSFPSLTQEDRKAVLNVCERLASKSVAPEDVISHA